MKIIKPVQKVVFRQNRRMRCLECHVNFAFFIGFYLYMFAYYAQSQIIRLDFFNIPHARKLRNSIPFPKRIHHGFTCRSKHIKLEIRILRENPKCTWNSRCLNPRFFGNYHFLNRSNHFQLLQLCPKKELDRFFDTKQHLNFLEKRFIALLATETKHPRCNRLDCINRYFCKIKKKHAYILKQIIKN